jgi:hypothetical protein
MPRRYSEYGPERPYQNSDASEDSGEEPEQFGGFGHHQGEEPEDRARRARPRYNPLIQPDRAYPMIRGVPGDGYARGGEADENIAEAVIMSIVHSLADSGPAGVHLLRKLTSALEDMADATMAKDHAGLEDAAADAHQVLSKLIGD